MKIIYVKSGYEQIYQYLEQWIIDGFKAIGLKVETFPFPLSPCILEKDFNDEKPLFALTLVGNKIEDSTLSFLKDKNIPLIIWLSEDPFYIDSSIKKNILADILFTVDLGAYQFYKENNIQNIYYLPLGTDLNTFHPKVVDEHYKSDLLILGYPYPSRVKLTEAILKQTNYKITVIGKWWYNHIHKNYRKHKNLTILNRWVPPNLASNYYNGAKIILNPHRESNLKKNKNSLNIKNKSINNRTFDLAACAAFQLIEYKDDVYNHFKEDEIIPYYNLEDCFNKIHYYMQNETKRKRIAFLGYQRTILNHTMKQRAKTILNTFQSHD
ncbi:CgeB family protein [Metabacillus fastidiosus]|uniref:CgeB family protein n=1 Tax=Metabacillus fastidiosus TaxID=1458 RepID=UPI003D2CBCBF